MLLYSFHVLAIMPGFNLERSRVTYMRYWLYSNSDGGQQIDLERAVSRMRATLILLLAVHLDCNRLVDSRPTNMESFASCAAMAFHLLTCSPSRSHRWSAQCGLIPQADLLSMHPGADGLTALPMLGSA